MPKQLKYQLAKGHRLELRGFPPGLVVSNETLAGKNAEGLIRAIQNWERETGKQVIGTQIVLK